MTKSIGSRYSCSRMSWLMWQLDVEFKCSIAWSCIVSIEVKSIQFDNCRFDISMQWLIGLDFWHSKKMVSLLYSHKWFAWCFCIQCIFSWKVIRMDFFCWIPSIYVSVCRMCLSTMNGDCNPVNCCLCIVCDRMHVNYVA